MKNPDINVCSELADKIIQLYRDVDTINIRKLSHMDFSVLGKDDKNRALLQIELDSGKQRKMFESIIGEPATVIVDVLIRELQNEINKDTLWRLFGDVIYSNIEANVNGTKICVSVGIGF